MLFNHANEIKAFFVCAVGWNRELCRGLRCGLIQPKLTNGANENANRYSIKGQTYEHAEGAHSFTATTEQHTAPSAISGQISYIDSSFSAKWSKQIDLCLCFDTSGPTGLCRSNMDESGDLLAEHLEASRVLTNSLQIAHL